MPVINRFPHFQFLSTNGDGTGNMNAIGNYSVTPGIFYAMAPANETLVITHLSIVIGVSGAINMLNFGGIAGGLTNGIVWTYKKNGVIYNAFGDFVFKQNVDFEAVSNVSITTYGGGNQALLCEFKFPQNFTESVKLSGTDYISLTMQDDLSTLSKHYIAAKGRLEG